MPINKLRRIFETAEKGLTRYLHPSLKNSMYPRVQDLERFIDLGYSSQELTQINNKKVSQPQSNCQMGPDYSHNFARNDSEIIIVEDDEELVRNRSRDPSTTIFDADSKLSKG